LDRSGYRGDLDSPTSNAAASFEAGRRLEATRNSESGEPISSVAESQIVDDAELNNAKLAELAKAVGALDRRTAKQAVEIGRLLTEIKARLGHGPRSLPNEKGRDLARLEFPVSNRFR
jgi:hypothetical protein